MKSANFFALFLALSPLQASCPNEWDTPLMHIAEIRERPYFYYLECSYEGTTDAGKIVDVRIKYRVRKDQSAKVSRWKVGDAIQWWRCKNDDDTRLRHIESGRWVPASKQSQNLKPKAP